MYSQFCFSVWEGFAVADNMKERLSASFQEALKTGDLNPNQMSGFLLTCSHFDFKPEGAIRECKRFFVDNYAKFAVGNVTMLVHGLCLLDEIDNPVIEALRQSKLASVAPSELSVAQRKHICKLLIALKILYNKVCFEEPHASEIGSLTLGSSTIRVERGGRSVLCCPSGINRRDQAF